LHEFRRFDHLQYARLFWSPRSLDSNRMERGRYKFERLNLLATNLLRYRDFRRYTIQSRGLSLRNILEKREHSRNTLPPFRTDYARERYLDRTHHLRFAKPGHPPGRVPILVANTMNVPPAVPNDIDPVEQNLQSGQNKECRLRSLVSRDHQNHTKGKAA
jgi:hypothetical protein